MILLLADVQCFRIGALFPTTGGTDLSHILGEFDEGDEYGMILRAKGIVASTDGKWLHFDYVPGEINIRYGTAAVIGRLCVIGSGLYNEKIKELFGV